MTKAMVMGAGVQGSKRWYVWVAPGASAMYPDGRQDDTHLSVAGATEVARLAAGGLPRGGLPIARSVRGAP